MSLLHKEQLIGCIKFRSSWAQKFTHGHSLQVS